MNTHRLFTISIVGLLASAYGVDSLPPLKWVKPVSETTIGPKYMFDYSEDKFLCVDGNKMVLLSTEDGSVKKTVSGLKTGAVSRSVENGYVLASNDTITLVDSTLEIVWSKPLLLEGTSILDAIQTKDSGFVVVGNSNDTGVLIVRFNRNVDTLWTRMIPYPESSNYDGAPYGSYYSRIAETEGGYIVSGSYFPEPPIWPNGGVSKYSYTGTREWTQIITGLYFFDMIGFENGISITGRLDLDAASEEQSTASGLKKTLYFPSTSVAFVRIGSDGQIIANHGLSGGMKGNHNGHWIRGNDNIYLISAELSYYDMPIFDRTSVIAVNGSGEKKWETTIENLTIAQPLASGDIVILANDSLFYYSATVGAEGNGKGAGSVAVKQPFSLSRNRISFTLKEASAVTVSLYTPAGRLVRIVDMGRLAPGRHKVSFSGVAKGSYIVQCGTDKQKMIQGRVVLY